MVKPPTIADRRKEIDIILDMVTLREKPIHKDKIEAYFMDLRLMLESDSNMTSLVDWYLKHNIDDYEVERWIKKYPQLERSYHSSLQIIGDRRDNLACWNKMTASVYRSQPYYCRRYREATVFNSKQNVSTQSQTLMVVRESDALPVAKQIVDIPKCPNSDLVPKKEEYDI